MCLARLIRRPICMEGGELSVCASYNPLGLLFIVSNGGIAGKTQACLLASGQAQTATVLKCFDLSFTVVTELKVKMEVHVLNLKTKHFHRCCYGS